MDKVLERREKEAVTACCKVQLALSWHLPGGTERTHKTSGLSISWLRMEMVTSQICHKHYHLGFLVWSLITVSVTRYVTLKKT